ncbi:MAG TPA: phenylalanine--tRNA ligase subunit alpha [Acidimicrobiales bacterium]|nr:phenylalanine--tRNA ligase subunit alpha [Acidimicrobiales bacterium]
MSASPDTAFSIQEIEVAASAAVRAASSLAELEHAESTALGKKSDYAAAYQRLGALSPDDRREAGRNLNEVRDRLVALVAERRAELGEAERAARIEADRLDLTEVLPSRGPGHLHLVTRTQEALEDVFVGMGYEVAEGPEVETDWYNFEALNLPPDHPARGMWDTFYIDMGEAARDEKVLMRTHTSPMQIRLLESKPPPIYAVVPGRAHRRDTPDASHLSSFHQLEAIVVDHGITFGHLAGTIETFTTAYFGPKIHSRLRPSYFPFTEPSAELDITCTICEGSGCRTCSGTGWLELGGCGMIHPAVLENVGLDSEEWTGFAFGFGIDRLAQMRYGISDLRSLVENDLRFMARV